MQNQRSKTAAEISNEMMAKARPQDAPALQDFAKEVNKGYLQKCMDVVQENKHLDKPYFITVLLRKDPMFHNMIQRFFFARETLPTPTPDQTVWMYDPKDENLQLIWMLPREPAIKKLAAMGKYAPKRHRPKVFWSQKYLQKKLHSEYYRRIYGQDEPE